MSNTHIYPTKYELIEVLTSITNRTFLNSFAQERGAFITHVTLESLANEISNMFLDNDDLEIIRKEAYHINASHTLSGFVVKSTDKNFNLKNSYQWIFDEGKQKFGQKINQLVKVTPESNVYKGSIEYNKKRAGRIEFLQDEISHFDFYLEEKSPGNWQVEIDGNRSTDSKELKDLFHEVLNSDANIENIEQILLTTELSIQFFDSLANNGMPSDWKFSDIKHLTLKMGNADEQKSGDSEDDTEKIETVKEEALVGITQAILQGQNLRENTFVQQSVKSGYRFNAMTYEFHHKTDPFIIQLKAEFKGRPKVFEVSIVNYDQQIGIAASREAANLSASENRKIRSDFWNNSKEIYNKLIKRK